MSAALEPNNLTADNTESIEDLINFIVASEPDITELCHWRQMVVDYADAWGTVKEVIDEKLLEHCPPPYEGTEKLEADGFKVSTYGRVNRTISEAGIRELEGQLPPDVLENLFPVKHSLNLRFYKSLQEANPERFKLAARAVTEKPGKPGVKVEEITEKG